MLLAFLKKGEKFKNLYFREELTFLDCARAFLIRTSGKRNCVQLVIFPSFLIERSRLAFLYQEVARRRLAFQMLRANLAFKLRPTKKLLTGRFKTIDLRAKANGFE